jgi:hypothetical protein
MKIEDYDFDVDLEDYEDAGDFALDLDIIKNNIPKFSSEKLCEMVVSDRYLGFNREAAILCMQELSNRRINGDVFNFEDYIEEEFNKLPKLDFSIVDLRTIMNQAIGNKK